MAQSLRTLFFTSRRSKRPTVGAGTRGQARHGSRQRLVRYFDCTWISASGPMDARISSLSPTGCYIDSRFIVPAVGAVVDNISVDTGTGQPLVLGGAVVDSTPGIGFAVRFAGLDEDMQARLLAVVKPGPSRSSL